MSLDAAILDLCREVTEAAILPRYRNLADGEIFDKGGNDPVTVADRESEALLREGLAKLDNSLEFVGEESVHSNPSAIEATSGPCWIVDPLDGTRNFAAGRAPFGILVARAEHGSAQSGWIYDCLTGRFCCAHHGSGAFVDGEAVTARATGETPPVAAISLLFMDNARREKMRSHIQPHYRLVDIPYCAAEQYPRLGLGENDLSVFERTLPWDHAAGALWLGEAGGKVARPDGTPYRVDDTGRTGLIGASSARLWDELAARIAEVEGATSISP